MEKYLDYLTHVVSNTTKELTSKFTQQTANQNVSEVSKELEALRDKMKEFATEVLLKALSLVDDNVTYTASEYSDADAYFYAQLKKMNKSKEVYDFAVDTYNRMKNTIEETVNYSSIVNPVQDEKYKHLEGLSVANIVLQVVKDMPYDINKIMNRKSTSLFTEPMKSDFAKEVRERIDEHNGAVRGDDNSLLDR